MKKFALLILSPVLANTATFAEVNGRLQDSLALAKLFYANNRLNWTNHSGWLKISLSINGRIFQNLWKYRDLNFLQT